MTAPNTPEAATEHMSELRSRPGAVDRFLAAALKRTIAGMALRVRLPDGTELGDGAESAGTIVFRTRRGLINIVRNPDLNFGEEYMEGTVDVEGDVVAVLTAITAARPIGPRRPAKRPQTPAESRDNVHHHYDLGNDFYRLWLDEQLLYTGAYFPAPETSLEAAQVAKMDRVCRKVRLRPGDEVIEAGCGWGALALHMARRYGARVRAFNVSREQVRYARERAAREGLSDRVEFIEDDYRAIAGEADAFVSVGMLEHVGVGNYPELGAVIRRVLRRPDGRGLLHFIGRNRPGALNEWITKRIFPGAYPPTLPEVFAGVFEPYDFVVLDVENLRLHYAKTLAHWLARFRAAEETVRRMFDERFVRAWRLYLSGSQAAFRAGSLQLFQVVFSGRESAGPWWTRDEMVEADRIDSSTEAADGTP
jgi:cyclopropane-fatty-acyl-phospholipid synthase